MADSNPEIWRLTNQRHLYSLKELIYRTIARSHLCERFPQQSWRQIPQEMREEIFRYLMRDSRNKATPLMVQNLCLQDTSYLNLSKSVFLDVAIMQTILASCPKISHLILKDCRLLEYAQLEILLDAYAHQLIELNLEGCLRIRSVKPYALRNLRVLNITRMGNSTEVANSLLSSNLDNLLEIHLPNTGINDAGGLTNLTRLEKIVFVGMALEKWLVRSNRVRSLHLFPSFITSSVAEDEQFQKCCEQLEEVSIVSRNFPFISLRTSTSLRCLHLRIHFQCIPELLARNLFQTNTNISDLNLSGVGLSIDEHLFRLITSNLTQLQSLQLGGNVGTFGSSLYTLTSLESLAHLSLHYTSIRLEHISQWLNASQSAKRGNSLKVLRLCSTELGVDHLKMISSCFPNLEILDLADCARLVSANIQQYAQLLTSLPHLLNLTIPRKITLEERKQLLGLNTQLKIHSEIPENLQVEPQD